MASVAAPRDRLRERPRWDERKQRRRSSRSQPAIALSPTTTIPRPQQAATIPAMPPSASDASSPALDHKPKHQNRYFSFSLSPSPPHSPLRQQQTHQTAAPTQPTGHSHPSSPLVDPSLTFPTHPDPRPPPDTAPAYPPIVATGISLVVPSTSALLLKAQIRCRCFIWPLKAPKNIRRSRPPSLSPLNLATVRTVLFPPRAL